MGHTIKGHLVGLDSLNTLELNGVIAKAVEYSVHHNTYLASQWSASKDKPVSKWQDKSSSRWQDKRPSAAASGGQSSAEPMDLSAISLDNLPSFKDVDPDVVAERFSEKLCLYCGKGPHFAHECRSLLRDDPDHPLLQSKKTSGKGKARGKRPPRGKA
jgi:hypothetical protein